MSMSHRFDGRPHHGGNLLHACRGFSLIEVMIIVSVLAGLGTATLTLAPQFFRHAQNTNQVDLLHQADRQLRGFAVAHGRLPCPDINGDGAEQCTGGVAIGRLPYKTLGLGGEDVGFGRIPLRYGVYRNAASSADLAILKDRFNPTDADNLTTTLNQTNSLDLCDALDNGATATASTALLYMKDGLINRNVAYAVAIAGAVDADAINGIFDGLNGQTGSGFEASNRAPDSTYDDSVMVRGFSSLSIDISCDTVRNSLDALANGKAVTTEVADQASSMASGAKTASIIAGVTTALIGIDATLSALAVKNAATTLTVAVVALVAAIVACIASLGASCGAIAVPAAAVGLATAGLISAGVATGLNTAALVEAAIATGLTTAVAARASAATSSGGGTGLTQALKDLTKALGKAQTARDTAQTKEITTVNQSNTALTNFNTANTNLHATFNKLKSTTAIASLDATLASGRALDRARQILLDKQQLKSEAQSDLKRKNVALTALQAKKICIGNGMFSESLTVAPYGTVCRSRRQGDPGQARVSASQFSMATTTRDAAKTALTSATAAEAAAKKVVVTARNLAYSQKLTTVGQVFKLGSKGIECVPFSPLLTCLTGRVINTINLQFDYLTKKRAADKMTQLRINAENRVVSIQASLTQIQCLADGKLYDTTAKTCNSPPTGPEGIAATIVSGADAILQSADGLGVAK